MKGGHPQRITPTPKGSDHPIPIVSVLSWIMRKPDRTTATTSFPNVIRRTSQIHAIPRRGSARDQVFQGLGKVGEHKVGLALATLSHGQQSAVTALHHLYTEVQISGKISNNRLAQYWNNLEELHDQVHQ
jgi:hypothetical protein